MKAIANHMPSGEMIASYFAAEMGLGRDLDLASIDQQLGFASFRFGEAMAAGVFAERSPDPATANREEGLWRERLVNILSSVPEITGHQYTRVMHMALAAYRARFADLITRTVAEGRS